MTIHCTEIEHFTRKCWLQPEMLRHVLFTWLWILKDGIHFSPAIGIVPNPPFTDQLNQHPILEAAGLVEVDL